MLEQISARHGARGRPTERDRERERERELGQPGTSEPLSDLSRSYLICLSRQEREGETHIHTLRTRARVCMYARGGGRWPTVPRAVFAGARRRAAVSLCHCHV